MGRLGVIPLNNIKWLDFPVSCLAVFSLAWYRKEGSWLLLIGGIRQHHELIFRPTLGQYFSQVLVNTWPTVG